jgi:mannitol/fructose-specific phosphotransferase system IIA component (Ntr-type)
MKVSQYLSRSHVLSGVPAADRDDAVRASIELLAEAGAIPAKSVRTIVKGILEREVLGSTGIGKGIAIPHVKTRVVDEPIVAYARLADGVEFGATDGAPVQSLFFVISPFSAAEDHVAILRWISRIARSDYYAKILANTSSADSLHDLFQEIDEQS